MAAREAEIDRLHQINRELQRHRFGRRAESLPSTSYSWAWRRPNRSRRRASPRPTPPMYRPAWARTRQRRANRGALPAQLPRVERVIDLDDRTCPCCRGDLHVIAEDVAERLDIMPAHFRVLVTRRPRDACGRART